MTGKRVLPVLHLVHEEQVLDEASVAYGEGADGLFLIDMGASMIDTRAAVDAVRTLFPDKWLGVNVLGYDIPGALRHVHQWPIQGLWVDHSGIDERPLSWQVMPAIRNALFWSATMGDSIEVFGGVAFKYGRTLTNEAALLAAQVASQVLPVVCTSGDGTGIAADLHKLECMAIGINGSARLAVASGVDPANAKATFRVVDDALMATGIEKSFGRFDPLALRKVVAAAQ